MSGHIGCQPATCFSRCYLCCREVLSPALLNERELVNPGSVGMPLDGDTRGAWAMWDGRDFTLHRTEYDVERVVAAAENFGGMSDVLVHRYRYASD